MILSRTPYNNNEDRFVEPCIFFVQHGYVVVIQDIRGRFDSEGQFYPWVNDYNDGYDTIQWIGSQPWCDGNVGMIGGLTLATPLPNPQDQLVAALDGGVLVGLGPGHALGVVGVGAEDFPIYRNPFFA